MANTKSAIKNARKNARRSLRNQRVKSRLKTLAKRAAKASKGEDPAVAKTAAQEYLSALDKAANKGVVHRNSASRHKSVYAKLVQAK